MAERRKIANAQTSTGIIGEAARIRLDVVTDLLMLWIAAEYHGFNRTARSPPAVSYDGSSSHRIRLAQAFQEGGNDRAARVAFPVGNVVE